MNYERISPYGIEDLVDMELSEKDVDMTGWEVTFEVPSGVSCLESDGSRIIKWVQGEFSIHKCINQYGRAGYSVQHAARRGESLDFLKTLAEAKEYWDEHRNYDFSSWEDRGRMY